MSRIWKRANPEFQTSPFMVIIQNQQVVAGPGDFFPEFALYHRSLWMRSVWSHLSSLTGPGIIPLFWQRSWASEKFDAYRAGKWGRQDSSSVWVSSAAQSCSTLCDPMNRSTPDLHVHHQLPEFTQTHVHWVCMLLLSRFNRVRLCATPQTAAHCTPPSLGFSRQEHWSGFSSVQSLSRAQLFATPWIAARQASLSITKSQSILKLMPIK